MAGKNQKNGVFPSVFCREPATFHKTEIDEGASRVIDFGRVSMGKTKREDEMVSPPGCQRVTQNGDSEDIRPGIKAGARTRGPAAIRKGREI
jgi:hypothetical protein